MCVQMDLPPEDVDPGEWAVKQYRTWRAIYMNDGSVPPIPSTEEILMNMREEPPS